MKKEEDEENSNTYGDSQAPFVPSSMGPQPPVSEKSGIKGPEDIKIMDRNMVLNFGDKLEEEEDSSKIGSSMSGISTPHGAGSKENSLF